MLRESQATKAEIYITHFDSVILPTGAWAGGGDWYLPLYCCLYSYFVLSWHYLSRPQNWKGSGHLKSDTLWFYLILMMIYEASSNTHTHTHTHTHIYIYICVCVCVSWYGQFITTLVHNKVSTRCYVEFFVFNEYGGWFVAVREKCKSSVETLSYIRIVCLSVCLFLSLILHMWSNCKMADCYVRAASSVRRD